jgi:hypothetical protein
MQMANLIDDGKTLTMTWTIHLSAPLSEGEKDTIIGNLWEHIHNERDAGILGFVKVTRVVAPDGIDRDARAYERLNTMGAVNQIKRQALQKAAVLKFMRGEKKKR